jgi:hypothetical protein
VSDAHQGEAEVQAGDGPANEPQEERDGGSGEEEDGHGHTHFEGAIDEGEVNEELLSRFEMEANGDERGLEEDSSDDEDDPLVPRDWDTYNFSQLSVNAGENVAWEYRENAVSVGAMYKSAVEMKDAMKRWSTLTLQREVRVVKSSPHIYDAKCLKPNCPFRVYASKGKWKNYWEIKSVVDHTCVLEQLDASYHNLSYGFVASQMFAKIVGNFAFEPKSIILAIEEKFRYHISYGKAYMAKNKVMEMRWGTYEASYDNLPRWLNTIVALNPGSYYDIKAYDHVSRPEKQVLQRAFLALGPAIAAFKHCRPVICIDGTFLTGKYKGTILTVVAADGNNQLFPLAIAFAEGENGDSWYWFLERLKQMVVGDVSDVCVIHDRHKGILQKVVKSVTEQHNGQMCIAGGA